MEVWLDLEETIIDNWWDALLINPNRIKRWLDERNVTELRIWSFAIGNDEDKRIFERVMKKPIETALGRPILEWPSVEEMQKLVERYEGIIYDSQTEFIQINSKKWSFIKFCLGNKTGEHCVLIDDAVPNLTIVEHDRHLKIDLIKVQHI